jgi:Na+-transporting NADH:ubiquinone oxidoreductase subunit NqrC
MPTVWKITLVILVVCLIASIVIGTVRLISL